MSRGAARRSLALALSGGLLAACGSEEAAEEAWFVDVAARAGVAFTYRSGHAERYLMPEIMGGGAALLDADGDGDLDLYLVQGGSSGPAAAAPAPEPNRLFANDGTGAFRDVTEGSGADDRGYGMGVAAGDADGDGRTDLYVTNLGRDTLLVNAGGGRFTDVTARAGADHGGWSTSASFFDYDRDGALDLYVADYLRWAAATERTCRNVASELDYCSPKEYRAPTYDVLYRNAGDGTFEDRSEAAGIRAEAGTGLGVGCADFDGDGWQDVFVANDGMADFLWHNRGDGTFANEAWRRGCSVDENGIKKAGMGVALGDVDADGDTDLLVCNLRNESDSLFLNDGGYFADRTSRSGLAQTSKLFTRFGVGFFDFDADGTLDLYEANGRVEAGGTAYSSDPYAEPNLLFRGLGGARFEEVLPRGGTSSPVLATSRAAAFGDLDGDGAVDVVVVNRDAPASVLRNARRPRGHWVLLHVRERTGGDALGAEVDVRAGARVWHARVSAGQSYLASNDPRVHVGLGALETVESVGVRWVDGERETWGPLPADRVHVLSRGAGTPAPRD